MATKASIHIKSCNSRGGIFHEENRNDRSAQKRDRRNTDSRNIHTVDITNRTFPEFRKIAHMLEYHFRLRQSAFAFFHRQNATIVRYTVAVFVKDRYRSRIATCINADIILHDQSFAARDNLPSTPLINFGERSVPKRFASSTASLIATPSSICSS